MSGYTLAHAAAVVVFLAACICGGLVGAHAAGFAPSWLTSDVAQTAGVVGLILAPIAGFLPRVQRRPSVREANYLRASVGVLPPDLAAKHPTVTPPA